jgi:hypothetical protein
MPSRIHATIDGSNTICGYSFNENFNKDVQNNHTSSIEKLWVKSNDVPRKANGYTRYCPVCFKNTKKSLEWL